MGLLKRNTDAPGVAATPKKNLVLKVLYEPDIEKVGPPDLE